MVGNELVCPGHGWAFDGLGNTYKRNEFGRVDPKGRVSALHLEDGTDTIEVSLDLVERDLLGRMFERGGNGRNVGEAQHVRVAHGVDTERAGADGIAVARRAV